MNKKYIFLIFLVLGLVGAAGMIYLFARMYQNDMRALNEFVASYEAYDQAIVNLKSSPTSVESGQRADQALTGLNSKSHIKVSSLIKNEKQVMSTALEIDDLSGKEFIALQAYQKAAAAQGANLDQLAKELGALTGQRQAAFAGFMELGK